VTVYNAAGYLEKNDFDAYSLNNATVKKVRTDRSISSLVAATARFRTAADHAGVELLGSSLSPTRRDP
jgi:hypothetical protein